MNYLEAEITNKESSILNNHLPKIGLQTVQQEIIKGLKEESKYISSKFFYNEKGSELFEDITHLKEYYPTRTEKTIISRIKEDLQIDFSNVNIIELGSGDHSKISLLLDQISESDLATLKYFPVDISQSAIEIASTKLHDVFPQIEIHGIVADFLHQLHEIPKTGHRLFCFFGSTIGNLNPQEVEMFMKLMGKEMQQGESFLLGMDMIKNIAILEKAYNDDKEITAEFNKNILNVVNGLIDSDFNPSDFDHLAFYNEEMKRIEMHLLALKDVTLKINSSADKIQICKGESIHTENSHKFDPKLIDSMGIWGGLETKQVFYDENEWFGLVHFRK